MFAELEIVEEWYEILDRHAHQFGDRLAAHLDIFSLFP